MFEISQKYWIVYNTIIANCGKRRQRLRIYKLYAILVGFSSIVKAIFFNIDHKKDIKTKYL